MYDCRKSLQDCKQETLLQGKLNYWGAADDCIYNTLHFFFLRSTFSFVLCNKNQLLARSWHVPSTSMADVTLPAAWKEEKQLLSLDRDVMTAE